MTFSFKPLDFLIKKDEIRFTFPIGTGLANTFLVGKTPVRVRLEYWYFVARPDTFGTEHQLRLVFTPVVPLPWKSKK